jgi:hypothetical protein
MSYHLHRHDETGLWSCGGPYTLEHAISDAQAIIRTKEAKAGEKWKEVTPSHGFVKAWVNRRGDRLEIKEDK